ncbi:PREDICTED: uncharacterized protein LOC104820184 [Tarenaya hassleriana]|uniref:uncharacterized protein LOC104820184 n=1 Tax=Tarenaya hassleriana TaxID=28532 RepID=UPI00053C8850|nr:PREDICTED: uncharacterized protein LOC104820184 [Tarenaya hassleriana]
MSNLEKQFLGSDAKGIEEARKEETIAALMKVSAEENRFDDKEVEIEDEGEEAMMREIVLGLPTLRLHDDFWDNPDQDDDNPDKDKPPVGNVVVAVGEEEAVIDKGRGENEKMKASGSESKKRSKKPKVDGAGASGSGSAKKRAPELIDPPAGPPVCPYCHRVFGSWKAVFGHLRAHKERQHHGFLPPPRFSAAAEGIIIGCSGNDGDRSVSVIVAASDLGGGSGNGDGKGLDFDLNVMPNEDSEENIVPNLKPKSFDLNKSPKKEDPEEDQL